MRFFKKLPFIVFVFTGIALLAGCKVGDDDPAISFRSRDARLKGNWKMRRMENYYQIRNVQAGAGPVTTVIHSSFDGFDLRVITSVNGVQVSDSTIGFNYQMMLKDDGKLSYENTVVLLQLGTKSDGSDNWYWLNSDKKKSRVYLGSALQFAAVAGINQSPDVVLPLAAQFTDFAVDGLHNKNLKLSYNRMANQATLGGFQEINVSSQMEFDSK